MKLFCTIISRFSLLASIVLFFLIALPTLPSASVKAEGEWVFDYANGRKNTDDTSGVNKSSYVFSNLIDMLSSFVEMISGAVEGVTVPEGTYKNDPEYAKKKNQGSAITGISNVIIAMYANPPADLALWIQDTGQTLGFLPKQAYAQGVGFSGLAPLLPIWKAFRNIAYLLLAIVMIVIGFMVMLRKKIDPKTVVTVQNALPRIVITLLLITFSYAIVSIFIDMMYVIIVLLVELFRSTGLLPDYALKEISTFTSGGVPQNVNMLPEADIPWRILVGVDPKGWGGAISAGAGTIGIILGAIGIALTGFVPTGYAILGTSLSFALLSFLISLGMLFLMIKLFVLFLGAYISIILSLLSAPFQLLAEAIPGSTAFSSWMRNLLANIIVFPIGTAMFLLAHVFMKMSSNPQPLWHPPYTSLWVNNATSIGTLIALGILFSIPTIVNQAKEAFKAKPVVGAGVGAIAGVFAQPLSLTMQGVQFWMHKNQMDALRKVTGGGTQQETHKS